MIELVITEPAERDLDELFDYIAQDNKKAAERVYRAVHATAVRLIRFPNLGRLGRLPETREMSVTSLPYVIVYAATADTITIIAFLHTARDISHVLRERQADLKAKSKPRGKKT